MYLSITPLSPAWTLYTVVSRHKRSVCVAIPTAETAETKTAFVWNLGTNWKQQTVVRKDGGGQQVVKDAVARCPIGPVAALDTV